MQDGGVGNITVCFGGFRQSTLDPTPNAYSAWVEEVRTHGEIEESVINLRNESEPGDSLLNRWRRAEATLSHLCDREANIHILGYSIGCHLAVKFAHELNAISNRHALYFGDVYLIAPDPKYIENGLDVKESAYDEAKELWATTDAPGTAFSLRLRTLPDTLRSTVRAIYSTQDDVAVWDGNVRELTEECAGVRFKWDEIKIDGLPAREQLYIRLDPAKARDEHWVHSQLFANVCDGPGVADSGGR